MMKHREGKWALQYTEEERERELLLGWERERVERAVSLYHPPACLSLCFSSFICAFLFSPCVLECCWCFLLPLCHTAAPVASSMMWSNRSPCRRCAMLISPWKQWHTHSSVFFSFSKRLEFLFCCFCFCKSYDLITLISSCDKCTPLSLSFI